MSQFFFEAMYGMLSRCEPRYGMQESDAGDQLQRGPLPPRDYADGPPLVCGLSAEHAPWRSTHGRTGGPRGSPPP